jgi:hypothetical protein
VSRLYSFVGNADCDVVGLIQINLKNDKMSARDLAAEEGSCAVLAPLTPGSTQSVTMVVPHAGIHTVKG